MRRVPLGYSERVWIRSKAVAEKMGVSQKKFSLFVDIDRTYLAFVGAGRGNVSLNNIKKIADGFNIVLARCFIRSSAWIKALPINVMIVLLTSATFAT